MRCHRIWFGLLALAAVLAATSRAQAVPLLAGATLFPAPVEADPIGGSVIDSVVQGISTPSFTGTLTSEVISGGVNPLGGLTFTYLLQNISGTHSLSRLTVNGYLASSGIVSADVSYNPSLGNIAPAYIDRSTFGETVGFTFAGFPVGFGTIAPGQSSYLLVVQTDSPAYAHSLANVINGAVEMIPSFSPVPEPSTVVLALVSCCGLFGCRRFRKVCRPNRS